MVFRRKKSKQSRGDVSQPMTLMQHVDELKTRLFWVAVVFVVASACVYPFFDQIIGIITAPAANHEMYYFTVAGGLSFIIKICMYVGVIAAIPALVYHLYKFIVPVMNKRHSRNVAIYTVSSALLALVGIAFSYFVILPAALAFLTDISFGKINSLLSIDSYVSFVIAYLIAGALLFQLPVILLSINSIHRLKPKKLLSYERHVLVGAFIFAALLSPTPDAVNQAIMAAPIIIMYQVGIVLVWWSQRREAKQLVRRAKKSQRAPQPVTVTANIATPQPAESVLSHASLAFADDPAPARPSPARPLVAKNHAMTGHVVVEKSTVAKTAMLKSTKQSMLTPSTPGRMARPVKQAFVQSMATSRPASPRPIVAQVQKPLATPRPVRRQIDDRPIQTKRPVLAAAAPVSVSTVAPRTSQPTRRVLTQARAPQGIDGFRSYASI